MLAIARFLSPAQLASLLACVALASLACEELAAEIIIFVLVQIQVQSSILLSSGCHPFRPADRHSCAGMYRRQQREVREMRNANSKNAAKTLFSDTAHLRRET